VFGRWLHLTPAGILGYSINCIDQSQVWIGCSPPYPQVCPNILPVLPFCVMVMGPASLGRATTGSVGKERPVAGSGLAGRAQAGGDRCGKGCAGDKASGETGG